MRILWLTWKDSQNPLAGGAEVVASELAKRLVQDGHEVIFVVGGFKGADKEAEINGYKVIRVGGRVSVYWHAYKYVNAHLADWPDIVIEEVNTVPFFSRFYLKNKRRRLLFHMLCRKIWFYQMAAPLSLVGYLAEPFYIRLLRKDPVITVSESTKWDLVKHGYAPYNITIISEGLQIEPVNTLSDIQKFEKPTMLSLGSMRDMKQTLDQIKAFEIAKQSIPDLQLKIAGDASDSYGQKVLRYIKESLHKNSIEYLGKVSHDQKQKLLQKSHFIAVTSVKEGWGLIVTEAASQGTPAVVYNVDGLRDSVRHNRTGLITDKNTPHGLAGKITELLRNPARFKELQHNAWEWSKEITFDNSYQQFLSQLQGDHGAT